MSDVIPLRLLKPDGGLFPGEITGRPPEEAEAMIKAGRAERLTQAQEAAPAKPPADKAVKAQPKGESREGLAKMAEASESDEPTPVERVQAAKGARALKELADELGIADAVDLRYGEEKLRAQMLDALG